MAYDDLPDSLLVQAIADGHVDALGPLVRRHQDRVRRLAYRFLGEWGGADDVAQYAFLRVVRAAPRYEPTARFTTWLHRIVVNLCLDARRRRARFVAADPPDVPDDSPADFLEHDEAVERHLDACEACRRRAAELRRVHAALGRWTPQPPDADLWPAIRDGLAREPRPRRALLHWPGLLRWAAAVGVGAFLATLSTGEEAADSCPLGDWLGMPTEECRALCGVAPGFIAEARSLAAELREQREGFASLLEDPQSTGEAVLARSEMVIAAHDALERRVVRHLLLIRPHLSPSQQRRLMGLCADGIRRGPDYHCPCGREGDVDPAGAGAGCGSGTDGCCSTSSSSPQR